MLDIEQFWVGLMEGDGSIQVNHWRKKIIQYRLIIKLKNTLANEKMLKVISKKIGGYVKISSDKEDAIWVENTIEKIVKIIKIFEKYPPLTARKKCQLEFLKNCLEHNNVELYLQQRNSKYDNPKIFKYTSLEDLPFYYPSWLSGFIEAEGCFSITKKGVLSYSIAQKYEKLLITSIKEYFQATSYKTLHRANELFEIKIYNKDCLKRIVAHCTNFPLQGEKKESLEIFKHYLK
jgi:hypothetical protein